ncbi:MAG: aminotransferase class I/II-fold pyridoxal phosphate-dependent enzyme [Planctomycetes bacterium]|nr:aminotransferase class I/II-fold pyridoxal phosphate-dependent enzyme [Planctomycetota bacterium]
MASDKKMLEEQAPLSWVDCYDMPGSDLFAKVSAFSQYTAGQRRAGLDFFRWAVMSPNVNRVTMRNPNTGQVREMIMLGSNSYLGLTSHPKVVQAAVEAAKKYGYGTGSVSLYSGTTELHVELEKRMARFYRCQDAILFPTGYAANVGAISALLRKEDLVVNDLFNHASIYDGCRLSGARMQTYAHGNMKHLERILKNSCGKGHGVLVITDGVFSMEGDVAKLDEVLALAKKYGARLMLDDSHALGVIGPNGRGTADQYGLEGQIDVTLGTLSKCLGGIGGVIAGSAELIDYLRFYARSYFFSGSVPTPMVAGALAMLDILENSGQLREDLWRNIRYMKEKLDETGFDTGSTRSAIIPVVVGDEDKLKSFLKDLLNAGIFMNYVAFPAVPKSRCRLRMSMMAGHSRKDLDYVLDKMAEFGKKHGIIR